MDINKEIENSVSIAVETVKKYCDTHMVCDDCVLIDKNGICAVNHPCTWKVEEDEKM